MGWKGVGERSHRKLLPSHRRSFPKSSVVRKATLTIPGVRRSQPSQTPGRLCQSVARSMSQEAGTFEIQFPSHALFLCWVGGRSKAVPFSLLSGRKDLSANPVANIEVPPVPHIPRVTTARLVNRHHPVRWRPKISPWNPSTSFPAAFPSTLRCFSWSAERGIGEGFCV
ncbi:hypothetical protein FA13DRAFT_768305 [Coprinellus micaceus]|uniref:Uncharacterized protein n=1 Tax=Coprinellus micaceus TaxID=71717 RepID=A0A4Y7S8G3_COPMI|nr:hypothetical protein FA13DRAFT_768305 [Coprinellus micaceus]